jgi:magnesium-transporting ATPase (P-type)
MIIAILITYIILAIFVACIIIAANTDKKVPLRGREILCITIVALIWPAIMVGAFNHRLQDKLGDFFAYIERKIYKK